MIVFDLRFRRQRTWENVEEIVKRVLRIAQDACNIQEVKLASANVKPPEWPVPKHERVPQNIDCRGRACSRTSHERDFEPREAAQYTQPSIASSEVLTRRRSAPR